MKNLNFVEILSLREERSLIDQKASWFEKSVRLISWKELDEWKNVKKDEEEVCNMSWVDTFDRNIVDEVLKEMLLTQKTW